MSEHITLTEAEDDWFREECAVCLGSGCQKCEAVRDEVERILTARMAESQRVIDGIKKCWGVDMRSSFERGEALRRIEALADEWGWIKDEDESPTRYDMWRDLRAALSAGSNQ